MPCSTAQLFHSPPTVHIQNIIVRKTTEDSIISRLIKRFKFRPMLTTGKRGKNESQGKREGELLSCQGRSPGNKAAKEVVVNT